MGEFLQKKSTIDDIKKRFDNDVERFSNLETGQTATIDAPLAMELITRAAAVATPRIHRVLDIGCGAGNNTIKLLHFAGTFDCDLVDLSMPMLERARERVSAAGAKSIRTFQSEFRTFEFESISERYDVILAAAVFSHLRDDGDWEKAFRKVYSLTAPGGSVWITDMVSHEMAQIHSLMWERYGEYLRSTGGDQYREKVFGYI